MKIHMMGMIFLLFAFTASASDLPVIAVLDLESEEVKDLGDEIADELVMQLLNSGLFDVVERNQLKAILQEQGLSGSGLVEMDSAIQMGQLLGAGYLLTGRVVSASAEERSFSGYGIKSKSTILTLRVSLRVLDSSTGKLVVATTRESSETVTQGGGLRISDTGVFSKLAVEVSKQLTQEISNSARFKKKEDDSPQWVDVNFESTPTSADVEVDGIFYGNAGETLSVPGGLHIVRISLPGCEVWEKKVLLRSGAKIKATLPELADIKVEIREK
jgi:curli biogenesis system outer membrane secretion channel CsgG